MKRARILVVDDDPDTIDRLTQLLSDDYDVDSTSDWSEVSTLFFRRGCDLVLMDVNLPVLQGDKLVEILRSTGAKQARIVYHSSSDEDTLARLVRETGADGYLPKSLRAAELLRRIEAHLD